MCVCVCLFGVSPYLSGPWTMSASAKLIVDSAGDIEDSVGDCAEAESERISDVSRF